MELYIVRHGTTSWNTLRRLQGQTDIALDEEGRALAVRTGAALQRIPFDRCISSPLIRALETARLILAGREVPISTDERLKEISFGIFEGMSTVNPDYPCPSEDFRNFFDDPANYRAPENGESIARLIARTGSFLEGLNRTGRETLLISTHGAAMRALQANICGRQIRDFWYTGVPVNCAVAHYSGREDGWHPIGEEVGGEYF